jgi:hypothetical protein
MSESSLEDFTMPARRVDIGDTDHYLTPRNRDLALLDKELKF